MYYNVGNVKYIICKLKVTGYITQVEVDWLHK